MGIQGLLPFLKKIHTPVNVSQFQGCTVAIDAYCWLHKGAFSCADKLALGEKTEQYVYYCMKYVDYLLRNGLKPILVFDGCHLPSKKDVETSRRERREVNRKRAAQLLREGKRAEAKECLQRCVDITPQMALGLMNVCRARGVDCIVAPYEADAQLAYLNKAGIAQLIITEDSDLLLFGCEKVIFKMDFYGNGVLIERSRLNEVVDIQDGFYTFDKFRYMCILSGCDYLPSLPGIGLAKACKVFKVARQTDIRQLLRKLPSYLKMSLVVTEDYINGFIRADNTFLYQLAFDPLTRKLCPLTPYQPEVGPEEVRYAGPYFSDERALQIALGNVDIHTNEKIASFDPETHTPKYAKKQETELLHMGSIWKSGYRPHPKTAATLTATVDMTNDRPSLAGREMLVKNPLPKKSPRKRVREADDNIEVKSDTELTSLYCTPKLQPEKRRRSDDVSTSPSSNTTRAKDQKPLSSDEDQDDLKLNQRENLRKKQVLSPSKSTNQAQSRKAAIVTADDAFTLLEQDSVTQVTAEEKENGKKSQTPRRNKFAVSALAKRAKFNLDGAPSPSVRVEVKSRYFGSGTSRGPVASEGSKMTTESSPSVNKNPMDTSPKKTQEKSLLETDDSPGVTAHQSDHEESCSRNEVFRNSSSSSLLSRFGYTSEKAPNSEHKISKTTGSGSKTPKSRTSSNSSPGSAFSWSSFKFTKSNSAQSCSSSLPVSTSSNKPFKRVSSESRGKEAPLLSSQELALQDGQGDATKTQSNDTDKNSSDVTQQVAPSNSKISDSPGELEEDEGDHYSDISFSQCSASDRDINASQCSNLYSIDSDCFTTSQDFVDLTDCENDSQPVSSGKDSDFASPASTSQISLKTPKSTPRTTTDTSMKKCRVSGLSRSKKKAWSDVDNKQQKIRDMFSRFAHQKGRTLNQTSDTNAEDEELTASGDSTPTNPLLAYSTQTHRKLHL